MQVAMYYSNNDVRLEQMPKPEVGVGELLFEVKASGICGTDVLEWYRKHKVPLVLGHEVSGVVAEVGQGVEKYKVGDRITVAHHVPCGTCSYCLNGHETVCEMLRKTNFYPGGFAEYIRMPKVNVEKGVFLLPDNVSFEEATFVEPLACVMRGQRAANFKSGKSVLVIGSGISGVLHIRLAKLNGAKKIFATDVQDFRLKAAIDAGADITFDAKDYSPDKLRDLNDGHLADMVVVCTGATSAYVQALQSIERGGSALIFAATGPNVTVPLAINELFWRNEVSLVSTYGASPQDYKGALDLIAKHELDLEKMITHRLSLADTGEGIRLVAEAKESLKIIIKPSLGTGP